MSALSDQLKGDDTTAGTNVEKEQQSTVGQLLDGIRPQLETALTGRMDVARFSRIVLTEVRKNNQLIHCYAPSLLGAVMTAAQLGLEPGPLGLCYLIPRRNRGKWEVQFQLGYRGVIDLALRGGKTLSVDAHVVREPDDFDYRYGTEPFLHHRPKLYGQGEPPAGEVAVYAVAQLAAGGSPFTVLDLAEVARRRARGAGDSPAWKTDWDAMARKSAVLALRSYLPQTGELAVATRLDETTRTDLTAHLEDLEPDHDVDDDTIDVPVDEVAP